MRTPAGAECAYYYEDMHRGREVQECRVARSPKSARWTEADCGRCPVPAILMANGSRDLQLVLTARRGILGFGAVKLTVEARCGRHGTPIADPYVGCPRCAQELLASIDPGIAGPGGGDV